MKFKVGDKVRVTDKFNVDSMVKSIVTISSVYKVKGAVPYRYAINEHAYSFTEEELEQLEQEYTTLEAIEYLAKNPKAKFKTTTSDEILYVDAWDQICIDDTYLRASDFNTKWTLVQKKVSFVKAYKKYSCGRNIKSNITNQEYGLNAISLCCATDDEIDGDWIILD